MLGIEEGEMALGDFGTYEQEDYSADDTSNCWAWLDLLDLHERHERQVS